MAESSSVEVNSDEVMSHKCEKHPTKEIHSFCTDHDDVVCDTCLIASHGTCKISTLDVKISNMTKGNEFNNALKRIGKLKADYESLLQSRKNDKKALIAKCDECLLDVRKVRKNVNLLLDTLESEVEDNLIQIKTELTTEIDRHCIIIADTVPQIETISVALSKLQKQMDRENMFIGMMKAKRYTHDYENIKAGIDAKVNNVEIRFVPDSIIEDLIQQINFFGKAVVTKKSLHDEQNVTSLVNTTLHSAKKHNVGANTVFGCSFVSDEKLLLACGNDGVKLLDNDIKVIGHLADPAFGVASINSNDVIVAQGTKQQLKVMTVTPSLKAGKTIKIGRKCWNVDVYGDNIFVACHDDPGNGEVRMLSKEGVLHRRLGIYHGNYQFIRPSSVKVSKHANLLFVSDGISNIVSCIDTLGNVKFQYFDADLRGPAGIFVDDEDNILVCGKTSNSVHVITRDGKKANLVSMLKNKVERPTCVSYRSRDGVLVVGLSDEENALVTFQTKKDSQASFSSYLYRWMWR